MLLIGHYWCRAGKAQEAAARAVRDRQMLVHQLEQVLQYAAGIT